MSDKTKRIASLVSKYRLGQLDEPERQELEDWRKESPHNEESFIGMLNSQQQAVMLKVYEEGELEKETVWEEIQEKRGEGGKTITLIRWKKYTAVAAALLILLGGAYFLAHNKKGANPVAKIDLPVKKDLAPGHDGAVLQLADGTTLVLDSAANGNLAVQGHTKVVKLSNGQLAYTIDKRGSISEQVLYNELSTPRGRQFQITLPDGSRAWLNAASSIRYPTAFTGKDRTVEITGEAYFEIAHDASRPFHVKAGEMDVQVLGTHFNINAYQNEQNIMTTLLEGKVKITKGAASALLAPGQQAALTKADQLNVLPDADVEATTAWKNGYFQFKKESIEAIMRQVARWYDVDVQYEGEPVAEKFYSKIPRSVNVSTVFKSLEATGSVHFKIDGNKIIVTR